MLVYNERSLSEKAKNIANVSGNFSSPLPLETIDGFGLIPF